MTRANTPSEPQLERHKISRKSHKKSRNGCENCKRRRIKCNEEPPKCFNCVKHDDQCSFQFATKNAGRSSTPSSVAATPSISDGLLGMGLSPHSSAGDRVFTPFSGTTTNFNTPRSIPMTNAALSSSNPRLQPAFSLADMELYHNYQTATCHTMSGIPELQTYMRVELPKIGFVHSFVLDCLLAVSALHIAHFRRDDREFYLYIAEQHYEVALRTAVNLMPAIDVHNCSALYLFASFCSTYTMAVGPKKGDFLLFSDTGMAEWRMLFKGVRCIIEANPWIINSSELAPMFEVSIRQLASTPSNNPHLLALHDNIVATVTDKGKLGIYLEAVSGLQKVFPMEPPEGNRGAPNTSQQAFTWLYKVEDSFVECLQRREPVALVVLAYFCVLLNDMGSTWWVAGWVDHLMSEIHDSLHGEHKMWLRWPVQEIGWIASASGMF